MTKQSVKEDNEDAGHGTRLRMSSANQMSKNIAGIRMRLGEDR